MELKTKLGESLVNYDAAVKVLAAARVHGYGDHFCITLCHPGVDPSVASVIVDCCMLSVIESCNFAEGLIRYYRKDRSSSQLYDWITTPGQALVPDLPYKES